MRIARLGDICDIVSGGTPSRSNSEFWQDGTIPWIKIGNIKGKHISEADEYVTQKGLDDSSAKMLLKGTILYTIFATLGEVGILDIDACTNQAIAGITVRDPLEVQTDYLYYYLKSKKNYVNEIGRGVAQNNINISILRNFSVPLPKIEDQKETVSVLSKAETIISARKQQLSALDNLIKARFVEMTEGADTVPTRMGDVATYINGYAFKPIDWAEKGLPIIRIQNLNDSSALFNYFSGNIDDKYRVFSGDVLVSWATHLEAYIWTGGDAWLNQHIFRVVFDKMPINKVYFVYSTEEALKQAFRNAHGFKPTMEHIKKNDFENAIVKLPSLYVQEEFARFAEQIDKSKSVIQKSLDETQLLFDSLMQQYFG